MLTLVIFSSISEQMHLSYHFQCGEYDILSQSCYLIISVIMHISMLRVPFNWKSPIGFLIAMTVQCTIITYMAMIGACVLAVAIGSYFYTMAASKCIKENLFTVTENCRDKSKRKLIRVQLIEFIDFHTQVKQLSNIFNISNHFI